MEIILDNLFGDITVLNGGLFNVASLKKKWNDYDKDDDSDKKGKKDEFQFPDSDDDEEDNDTNDDSSDGYEDESDAEY